MTYSIRSERDRMASLNAHERRITALEGRVTEVERCHGDSIYEMKRSLRKHDLRWIRMFEHFNIQDVTEEDVDDVLDKE